MLCAPVMMLVYRKVSGFRPVDRHMSATCSKAREGKALSDPLT
jgi:hypothetical protein